MNRLLEETPVPILWTSNAVPESQRGKSGRPRVTRRERINMNVWRITIKTDAVEGVDPRRFCLERNILGVGWPVDGPQSLDWDTYHALGTATYYDDGDKGWWPAVNAIRNRMTEGDLCWTRDWEGNYYLGRVAGAWEYRATPEHTAADVVNVRRCRWMRAGTVDSVPGKVVNSFRASRTVQAVHDETVLFYSKLLFNSNGEPVYDLPDDPDGGLDLFALALPEDCEDIVAIFLQAEYGYHLIPSTCRIDTVKTEFVLRNAHGKAQVQVKQGEVPLNKDQFTWDRDDPCEWFLFSTSGNYHGNDLDHVHCLDPCELRDFAFANPTMMPRRVQLLIEFCG